ncbi:MAG: glycoside hydrolase family 97 N-terminal domain-containing protein, partial [Proteobacteria bacterium]|nr:glycoside hydrolase family 97 N-terminal domain-containing protein [Pseudomonadota bacterium]
MRNSFSLAGVALGLAALLSAQAAGAAELRSPDGRIAVTVVVDGRGSPQYGVRFDDEVVVAPSRLGLRFVDAMAMEAGFHVANLRRSASDTTWEQPWGERRLVRDRYNEMLVSFETDEPQRRRMLLRFRAYDDGVGFRYEVP